MFILEQYQDIRQIVQLTMEGNQDQWWGLPAWGSSLWQIQEGGKLNNQTELQAKQAIEQSLEWLIETGLADAVEATTEVVGKDRLEYVVTVTRPSLDKEEVRIAYSISL